VPRTQHQRESAKTYESVTNFPQKRIDHGIDHKKSICVGDRLNRMWQINPSPEIDILIPPINKGLESEDHVRPTQKNCSHESPLHFGQTDDGRKANRLSNWHEIRDQTDK